MRFFEWFSNTVLQFRKEARLEAPFLLLWKCTIFQTHWLNRVHRSRVESAKNWDWKGGLLLFFLHTRANFSPKFFKCNLKAQLESFSSGRCLGISIEIAIPIVWCLARFFPIFQQHLREATAASKIYLLSWLDQWLLRFSRWPEFANLLLMPLLTLH